MHVKKRILIFKDSIVFMSCIILLSQNVNIT